MVVLQLLQKAQIYKNRGDFLRWLRTFLDGKYEALFLLCIRAHQYLIWYYIKSKLFFEPHFRSCQAAFRNFGTMFLNVFLAAVKWIQAKASVRAEHPLDRPPQGNATHLIGI